MGKVAVFLASVCQELLPYIFLFGQILAVKHFYCGVVFDRETVLIGLILPFGR
jgi:hypothetical protein